MPVMKPRDPRHKVLIRARLKAGPEWHDTCILNISSRGMLMQAAEPPVRGSYLEIRRGALLIVAKVVWTRHHRFGVRTQDVLPIEAIIADVAAPVIGEGVRVGERRRARRQQLPAEQRSRHQGRMIEFGFAVALVLGGAVFAVSEIHALLAAPVDIASAALGGKG